jgi:hypothetical protein
MSGRAQNRIAGIEAPVLWGRPTLSIWARATLDIAIEPESLL